MNLQVILFAIFAIGAVASALLTITRRNPVASAMSLVAHFFMLSGLYLTLEAQFVAAVQVLVYAGAIMVLVVFVIMLLNLGKEQQLAERGKLGMWPAAIVIGIFFGLLHLGNTAVQAQPMGEQAGAAVDVVAVGRLRLVETAAHVRVLRALAQKE